MSDFGKSLRIFYERHKQWPSFSAKSLKLLARPAGFEPATFGLEVPSRRKHNANKISDLVACTAEICRPPPVQKA